MTWTWNAKPSQHRGVTESDCLASPPHCKRAVALCMRCSSHIESIARMQPQSHQGMCQPQSQDPPSPGKAAADAPAEAAVPGLGALRSWSFRGRATPSVQHPRGTHMQIGAWPSDQQLRLVTCVVLMQPLPRSQPSAKLLHSHLWIRWYSEVELGVTSAAHWWW